MAGRNLWLPLVQHLYDTKNVAVMLWNQWLSPCQRRIVESSLSGNPKKAEDLVKFIALTHDLGKAIPAFAVKGSFKSQDLDQSILENMECSGFSGISNLRLQNQNQSPHNIAGQYILHNFGVSDDLASIIGAHHGRPVDELYDVSDFSGDYLSQDGYKENYYQDSDENSYIYKLWKKSRQDIFEWILEESSFESTASLPNLDMPSQVILSGLLIMADWIASSEEFFPLIEVQAGYIPQKLVERHGYDKWKEHETWSAKEVNDIEEVYKKRFGFTAREFQKNFRK